VEFIGPPPVITYTWPNTWNDLIVLIIRTNPVVARINGIVTNRNFCHAPAPSISALSIQFRRYTLKAGKEDDHVVAEVLPYTQK